MQSFHRHRGARAVATITEDAVLIVQFRGLLTQTSLSFLKAHIAQQHNPAAVVADYRMAAMLVCEADADRMMAGGEPANLPGLPAAVVAPAPLLGVFGDAAVRAAVGGRSRRVFRHPGPATEWAIEMAREGLGWWMSEALRQPHHLQASGHR